MKTSRLLGLVCAAMSLPLGSRAAEVDFAAPEIQEARQLIQSGQAECVLVKEGRVHSRESGHGVSPLMALYDHAPEAMHDAIVVDKVIGRAAAAIIISGRAKGAHAELMSEDGAEFLRKHGVAVGFDKLVPRILNRKRDDLCPLEKSVLGIEDPSAVLKALRAKIQSMQ